MGGLGGLRGRGAGGGGRGGRSRSRNKGGVSPAHYYSLPAKCRIMAPRRGSRPQRFY
ncbi:hypothetical protein O3P69_008500 [Scylla paramamosain]|uniref:Uncharacterized protein n=1 Tax=Scylla paramamosain TaxID=85552 RepID=A0AAW0SLK2_SCYPA